jgi:hypothetical protein
LLSKKEVVSVEHAGVTASSKSLLVCWAALVGLAVLAIRFCSVPWSAALLAAAIALALSAWRTRGDRARLVMIYLAAILAPLAAFEAYLGLRQAEGDGTRLEGTITLGFVHPDDVLGYAPDANARVTARKFHGNELIYDVVYTTDKDGLRVGPPTSVAASGTCLVFMGDSHSFGEGLNDDQTLSYQLGMKTGGRYAAYNFGFSGYGPHQMLANLQSNRLTRILHCQPTNFFYTALLEHVARSAGLAAWDRHGPRFVLDADGKAVRRGNFDDPPRLYAGIAMPRFAVAALDGFYTWQRLFGRLRDPSAADLELFVGIIRDSERLTQHLYPGSKFHVILWDGRSDPRLAVIQARLTEAGVSIIKVSAAIANYRTDWPSFVLSPYDLHPNALQYAKLADYIATLLEEGR